MTRLAGLRMTAIFFAWVDPAASAVNAPPTATMSATES
jgi:hypothetical protein